MANFIYKIFALYAQEGRKGQTLTVEIKNPSVAKKKLNFADLSLIEVSTKPLREPSVERTSITFRATDLNVPS